MNRRTFIKENALMAVAVSYGALIGCKEDKTVTPQNSDCSTSVDILGPFYKPGAPFREDIVPSGSTGVPLIISGKVYSACITLLKDAVVEIWNANADGTYDTSEEFYFRGRYKTTENGFYRFQTIIPGRYLNGSTYRPSHIHFRITAPQHYELISQIYFKDDPFIKTDPWASATKATERILTIGKNENNIDTVNFDIHLTRME
jgi:catechol 1,2-dioxygenase